MRNVKIDKETFLVLRALKIEESRQVPEILRDAVEAYADGRKTTLANLAKKLAAKAKKKMEPKAPAETVAAAPPE